MKGLLTVLVCLTTINASAGGGPSVNGDALVYIFVIAFLTVLLGMVYLAEFSNKIRKDRDYREHLHARVVSLISTVRAIFVKKKEEDNEERIDFVVSLVNQ